jgi:hypothetical protein
VHTEDPDAGSQVDLGAQWSGELAGCPSFSAQHSWGESRADTSLGADFDADHSLDSDLSADVRMNS